jgi:hypothetical protein
MVSMAVKKAEELHRRHPGITFPLDMESVATTEGCELVTWPFLRPVKEVKRGRWIGLAEGLDDRERRYLIAHALAHHLLHRGNQLAFHELQRINLYKQEREAEECAAHILMPESELAKLGCITTWEMSDYFGIPEELAGKRVSDFATGEERVRWEKLSLWED